MARSYKNGNRRTKFFSMKTDIGKPGFYIGGWHTNVPRHSSAHNTPEWRRMAVRKAVYVEN